MAATLTEAQAQTVDATFQGRVKVAMGISARNVLGDQNQPPQARRLAKAIQDAPDTHLPKFVSYVSSRTDLLGATQLLTTDVNIQAACDAALVQLATVLS